MLVLDLGELQPCPVELGCVWTLRQWCSLPRQVVYVSQLEPHDPAHRDVTGHIGTVSRPRGTGCIAVAWHRISDGGSDMEGKPGKNALLRGLAMLLSW